MSLTSSFDWGSKGIDPHSSSSTLFRTSVPARVLEPREWYICHSESQQPPWISHSYFVPPNVIQHLMRNKKNRAIGIKFDGRNCLPDRKPDQITNMEGALHTFVTPVILSTIHGDYQWSGGHSIHEFGSLDDFRLGRLVLVSALVQQDFEGQRVMLRVASLQDEEIRGTPDMPPMLDVTEKQNDQMREEYDGRIHRYMVYHLLGSHRLPDRKAGGGDAMSVSQTLQFLADAIEHTSGDMLPTFMQNRFFHHNRQVISMEVMFMTALHQVRNEFHLLEHLCAQQGFVYSFNPPAIFARFFNSQGTDSYDGTDLLSRIHVTALKFFAYTSKMEACKCVAWNDFASPIIISLLRQALANQPHIAIRRNDEIFTPAGGDGLRGGLYSPPEEAKDALLVIHNNSDAFGQNIETEWAGGSLDGVIGTFSSAAASLLRNRADLCDRLAQISL